MGKHNHAKYRLRQRYGFEASYRDLHAICEQIQHNKNAMWIKRDLIHSRNHWIVSYRDMDIYVVYSEKTNKLITALPSDEVERIKYADV